MSGHSKWSNIKHKKEKSDAVRGKIFTKIGREIAIAVREGGADPNNNSRLRDVIAKAKANNMPNDNIQRSIKKASGEGSGVSYEAVSYTHLDVYKRQVLYHWQGHRLRREGCQQHGSGHGPRGGGYHIQLLDGFRCGPRFL